MPSRPMRWASSPGCCRWTGSSRRWPRWPIGWRVAPGVFRAIKEGVRAQYFDGPAAARTIETERARRMHGSVDSQEGIAALKERRKPNFTGR